MHPVYPRRGFPCGDRLSGIAMLGLGGAGCKEGRCQVSGGLEGHPGPKRVPPWS